MGSPDEVVQRMKCLGSLAATAPKPVVGAIGMHQLCHRTKIAQPEVQSSA
jgi:hypothetical protein